MWWSVVNSPLLGIGLYQGLMHVLYYTVKGMSLMETVNGTVSNEDEGGGNGGFIGDHSYTEKHRDIHG